MSASRLLDLNDALDKDKYDIRALLIVRDCRLVFERYKDGVTRDHNHTTYSVTKSVTATLAGVLLHQGKLASLDTPIAALMAKPASLPPAYWQKAQRITLENVLRMSSGLAFRHRPNHPIYSIDTARVAVALAPRHTGTPGKTFNYSDADAAIAGAALAAAAGLNLYRFAIAALFDPLRMTNHAWPDADATNTPPGGWGLRLRPMDMAKLGQLYLQGGEWNGQRIIATAFVEQAWTPGASRSYGLYWWLGHAAHAIGLPYFYAHGSKGQWVFVFPTLNMVGALSASLPPAEVRAVEALVLAALAEAATANDPPEDVAAAALERRQAQGFAGETRVEQTGQDQPRR